ncbi:MAG: hypothetical protein ACYCXY_05500, partial [Acidimicrobiales bacterium]
MSGTTLHVGACRAGSSAAPEASRRHRGTVGVAAAAGVLGFAALVVLLYVLSAHVVPGNSDG